MDRPSGASACITLTTDFGIKDYFVGVLKGVLAQDAPYSRIIDITHDISPHDIVSAAFIVQEVVQYFPEGTVHLVIVDPGVGTSRKKIILELAHQFFIAPDNGVLTYLLDKQGSRVYEVEDSFHFRNQKSPTFAARDHYAPIAAALAKGGFPKNFGNIKTDAQHIKPLCETKIGEMIEGKVVYFDRFGNAITNIRQELTQERLTAGRRFSIKLNRKPYPLEIKKNYADGDEGRPNLIFNSSGWLEIFLPRGSAQEAFNLNLMDSVLIQLN